MAPKLDTEVQTVGQLIKTTRRQRDLSTRDMARILNTTNATVSNWETGKHSMKLSDAITFAEEMGIPVEWLIEAVKREKALTPKGEGQSCALTGSNRGPADYGSSLSIGIEPSVPDVIPDWMVAEFYLSM